MGRTLSTTGPSGFGGITSLCDELVGVYVKTTRTPEAGSVLAHQEGLSKTGLVSRGDVTEVQYSSAICHRMWQRRLGAPRSPEGESEPRL